MKIHKFLFLLLIGFFLFSCNYQDAKISKETYSTYQQKGDNITNLAQATLLGNVGKAIQKGGPEYAVEFCNLKASSIIDSLNISNNCNISRVSDKNRNPENELKDQSEKEIWKIFETSALNDTVVRNKDVLVYYKPIKIGLPACLKCHGNAESEISPATYNKIKTLYPGDLATGYQMGDFRGLWKVVFE